MARGVRVSGWQGVQQLGDGLRRRGGGGGQRPVWGGACLDHLAQGAQQLGMACGESGAKGRWEDTGSVGEGVMGPEACHHPTSACSPSPPPLPLHTHTSVSRAWWLRAYRSTSAATASFCVSLPSTRVRSSPNHVSNACSTPVCTLVSCTGGGRWAGGRMGDRGMEGKDGLGGWQMVGGNEEGGQRVSPLIPTHASLVFPTKYSNSHAPDP